MTLSVIIIVFGYRSQNLPDIHLQQQSDPESLVD